MFIAAYAQVLAKVNFSPLLDIDGYTDNLSQMAIVTEGQRTCSTVCFQYPTPPSYDVIAMAT